MAVRQEKNKKKWTKDGRSWFFDTYYTNEYGIRKEKKSKLYKLKKEAEDAEREFLNQIENNNYIDKNILFNSIYKEWLEFKSKQLKETTFYSLEKRTDKHILSFFKNYKLHDINIKTINKWCDSIQKKEIKLDYVNKIIGHLKELLKFAVDFYNFDIKIYSYLQPYKISSSEKIKNSEWNYWTYDEWKKFISVVDDDYYYLIFNFMYFMGWRLGEVIALKWKDVNFSKNTASVKKSFTTKVKNKLWTLVDPKTKNSIRDTIMDDELAFLLKKHYNNEKKIYNFNEEMFVFGNVNHLSEGTLRRHLNRFIALSEVKSITPHGFRHSHVSFLSNVLKIDIKEIADRIGDTPSEVERTYYHMFPERKNNIINKINTFKKVENNDVKTM